MNILSLLTKEKRVAGIEISDSVVRIAFFRSRRSRHTTNTTQIDDELVLIEEPIASNIIADGVVVDKELLGKTLKSVWEKANLGTSYAIVSIPHDKVYSRIFSFPRSVEGGRLTEAMRLAIGFQLPLKLDEVYLDWERTKGTPSANEILLSTVSRTVAQGYIESLELAGIKPLAIESHLASIARAIKSDPDQTLLFTEKTPDGVIVFALRDRVVRFSRALPVTFIPESKVLEEVTKIQHYLEAESKPPVTLASLLDAEIRDDYAGYADFAPPKAKWLIALGTAIRGTIPEGEDHLISLLPVGTEEAYAYQKATTFISLTRNIAIGMSVFFTLAFIGAYLFMVTLSQNADRAIATLSTTPVSPELLTKEEWINHTNALTATAKTLLADTPTWSILLSELLARTPDTITISNFSAPSVVNKMSLTGTARDRASLNDFKKTLQESPLLAEVELPITNLEQKEAIPFSISFRVADPSLIYYK